MKKRFFNRIIVAALSLAMVTLSFGMTFHKSEKEVKAAATTSSTLVWSDEFNGSSVDTSKWSYETGTGSWGWGNNEQQYYTNRTDNAYVSGGALHIRAKRESYGGMNYTSARLITNGKFTFTYGYVEARMALPACQGIWPAFWMLGANINSVGWPSCGEIDIMEAVNAEYKTYGTCHWNANGHAEYGRNTSNFDITQYHTYGMQWDSQYIRMFVDGNKYYEIYIGNNAGDTEEFHRPFYLLLNVAVGGQWPGYSIDNNAFPQEMKVDYVRVYQEKPSNTGSANVNTTSGDVHIYQDANYGGRSASLGVGNYNLASLEAKGFKNDDLTSLKVPSGYKVILYWDDNFSGASKVITGDTSNVGSEWNDKTSSIKVERNVNTASGDIYIYQDANYGGRSVSLGEGQYTLSSLQAKGFKNDDLSSIKVPFGYKVTLYWDDNFSGASKVITSDTSYVGNDWNDKASSIKVERAQYYIVNRHSGRVLDVTSSNTNNGANVQQYHNNGTNAQRWYIKQVGNCYTITSVLNGKALDVNSWSKDNCANIQMWDCGGDQANQQWYLTDLGNGYSSIINRHSEKSLDVADWSTSDGGNIQQYSYGQQANQQWKFQLAN
ncbi:RICIN domain-containing protein [uncultured Eubacterium sp.]|uniref:RICIN domain-containing protein n=1 Tax=uncultured Eubacterium sp. TaxID=165185 RepID=UPI002672D0A4|nr:RICIN domain-containing protein [uncultured Eubacterium sp.]